MLATYLRLYLASKAIIRLPLAQADNLYACPDNVKSLGNPRRPPADNLYACPDNVKSLGNLSSPATPNPPS